jgi:ribosome-associated protein
MNPDLVRRSIIDKAEIDYARSGGPGGQNVNKVNSKAVVRIRLDEVEGLTAAEAAMARSRLEGRLTVGGELVVQSDEERDQGRNREAALARLAALICGAAKIPKARKATRPTRASRERRLAGKRTRSESKSLRRKPEAG